MSDYLDLVTADIAKGVLYGKAPFLTKETLNIISSITGETHCLYSADVAIVYVKNQNSETVKLFLSPRFSYLTMTAQYVGDTLWFSIGESVVELTPQEKDLVLEMVKYIRGKTRVKLRSV